MSSSGWLRARALPGWAPWALFACAAAGALALGWTGGGFATSPAVAEVREATLSCPRTAHRLRVAEVLVTPGQAVTAGQVLARMDPGDVDAELAVARRTLQRLELAAGSTELAIRDDRTQAADRLAVEAERASVDWARLAAEQERDRSELAQLEAQLAQERRLLDERLTTWERVAPLELRHAALAAKVDESRRAVEEARRGAAAVAGRRDAWRGAVLGDGGRGSHVREQAAPARAAAEAQRERVRQLELLRAALELRAPFAGRVGQVLLQAGETAADGAVITVVDDRPRTAVAYVDQRWAARVRVGDRVRLAPRDGSGAAIEGSVAALAPAVTELPQRFWLVPTLPRYGRAAYVRLDAAATLPGQAFDATFRHARGARP